MAITLAVPREIKAGEKRVALTPEVIKDLVSKGFHVVVESKAGLLASISDQRFVEAGAKVAQDQASLFGGASIILKVNPPTLPEIAQYPQGATLVSFLWGATNKEIVDALASRNIQVFSMDAIPRISRAQKMDALSSQANLAGYKAVIMAANALGKIFPMLMTAAGTVKPARVVIMGAGVAGLQAIATAKRLGAIVEVSDIRPETKEQVESLGGKFIELKADDSVKMEGGYVKGVSEDFLARQQELIGKHVAQADIVITTALIPGKKAPLLITEEMVRSMKPGSVILDMAVEQGGNCALSECDKTVTKEDVTIIGESNLPSLLPLNASDLYARNINAFLQLICSKEAELMPDYNDEIVKGSLITRDGALLHPSVQIKANA